MINKIIFFINLKCFKSFPPTKSLNISGRPKLNKEVSPSTFISLPS